MDMSRYIPTQEDLLWFLAVLFLALTSERARGLWRSKLWGRPPFPVGAPGDGGDPSHTPPLPQSGTQLRDGVKSELLDDPKPLQQLLPPSSLK